MFSRQEPGASWQMAFTQVLPVGQAASVVQGMSTQPVLRACAGPMARATAGSQRWWLGQTKPASQGIGSQAMAALQRKPGLQLVAVQGGRHSEPMPSGLQGSPMEWQVVPLHSPLSAHSSRGGMPQTIGSLGPSQYKL